GGGRRNGVSEGVDVGGEGGGGGGQGAALPGGAPLLEGGPVAAVGGTGVGGPAVGDARGRGRAQLLVGAGDGMVVDGDERAVGVGGGQSTVLPRAVPPGARSAWLLRHKAGTRAKTRRGGVSRGGALPHPCPASRGAAAGSGLPGADAVQAAALLAGGGRVQAPAACGEAVGDRGAVLDGVVVVVLELGAHLAD